MTALDERFGALGRARAPELWNDIRDREPRSAPEDPGPGKRIAIATLALVVATAGIGFAVSALRGPSAVRATASGISIPGTLTYLVPTARGADVFALEGDRFVGIAHVDASGALGYPDQVVTGGAVASDLASTALTFSTVDSSGNGGKALVVIDQTDRARVLCDTLRDTKPEDACGVADPVWGPPDAIGIKAARGPLAATTGQTLAIYALGSGDSWGSFVPVEKLGDATPAFSPDGSRLAFSRVSEADPETRQLWMIQVGSDPRRLTDVPSGSQAIDPVWSPAGSSVAYLVVAGGSSKDTGAALWTVAPDGSGARQVWTCGQCGSSTRPVAWSGEGDIVLVKDGSLRAVLADGSERALGLSLPAGANVAWYPYVHSPA